MFDVVRNNRRIVQVFLALITLPFAFWGVESYLRNAASGDDVAVVGGSKIAAREFQQALQAQQDRLRASRPDISQATLDSRELRAAVVEGLINQKLLALYVAKSGLGVGDRQLAEIITSIPELQENGSFSKDRYEALVAAQGMTTAGFESRLRQDVISRQLTLAIDQASLAGLSSGEAWAAMQLEEREVTETVFRPENYLAKVKLAADAAKAYYDANAALFQVPEQIRAEYLVLSRQALAAAADVSDDDVKSWYAAHAEQFKQPEQRRASHILIKVAKTAGEADVVAAKAKIEEIRGRLAKDPAAFAALAKQYSQDPVSAAKGGDLEWFGKGAMVKAFEDAVFALKENETSDVVRSDFGFHVIRLTGLRAEKTRPLDEVRADVVAALREQAGQKKFAELSETFSNTVYEQADSLKPAVDKFQLQVRTTDWMSREHPAAGPLASPKVLAALFSDEAVKNARNTEAIEVSPGTLLSARVVEHKAAVQRPFDEVRGDIEKRLMLEEAGKLANRAGEEALAGLRKAEGGAAMEWGSPHMVSRLGAQSIPPKAVKAVFAAATEHLPAYAGTALPEGSYAVYKIQQVRPYIGGSGSEDKVAYLRQQYADLVANEELAALLTALRKSASVEINQKVLEARDRQ